jgi:hypothetical protein
MQLPVTNYALTHYMDKSPSWDASSVLIKNLPTFDETRRFITMFTRTH